MWSLKRLCRDCHWLIFSVPWGSRDLLQVVCISYKMYLGMKSWSKKKPFKNLLIPIYIFGDGDGFRGHCVLCCRLAKWALGWPGMVVPAFDYNTQEVEACRSLRIQGQHCLLNEFQSSLGSIVKPCLKKGKKTWKLPDCFSVANQNETNLPGMG